MIGEVKYMNYKSEWMDELNHWNVFFTKKKPYEYEREVRAAYIVYDDDLHDQEQFDNNYLGKYNIDLSKIRKTIKGKTIHSDNGIHPYLPGKYVSIDVHKLIEKICISPYVNEYFIDVINGTLEKYGISPSLLGLSELFYAKKE